MHVGKTEPNMSSSSSRPRTRRQTAEFYKNVAELKKNKNQESNGSGINSGLVLVKIEQDDDDYPPINSGLVDGKIVVDDNILPINFSDLVSVDRVSTSSVELNLTDGNFVCDGNNGEAGEENLGDEIVTENGRNSELVSESNVGNVGENTNLFGVLKKVNALPQVDLVVNNSDLDNSSRNLDGTNDAEHLNGVIVSNSCSLDNRRHSRLGPVSNVGNVGEKANLVDVVEEQALPQDDYHLFDIVVNTSGLGNSSRDLDVNEHLPVEIVSNGSNLGLRRSARLRSVSNVGNRNGDENTNQVNEFDLVANTSSSDNSGHNSDESDGEAEHLGREIVSNGSGLGNRGGSRLGSESNVGHVDEMTNLFDVLEKANALPQVDLVVNNSDLDNSCRNLGGTNDAEHLNGEIVSKNCSSDNRRGSRLGPVSNVGIVGENTNLVDDVEEQALPQDDFHLYDVVVNTSGLDNSSRDLDVNEHLPVEIVSNGSNLGLRRSARLRSVSNRNGDENANHDNSFDLVANASSSENSGHNSDESYGEAEQLGRETVSNGSGLGNRGRSRLGSESNVGNRDKNTNRVGSFDLMENTSDSDDSNRNSDRSDGENEHLGSKIVSNGSTSALNVGNIDDNVNQVDFFDLVPNTSDSDNVGGDSDGSDSDQSVDSESSSDEEDTEDPNLESTGDEPDDSDDSDYLTGEVGYYYNKNLGTNGDMGSSEEDTAGKALRRGRKVKRMKYSGDVGKDDSYSIKGGLNKKKRRGLEVLVHFGDISETELRSFKSQKKDESQLGKNTCPSPMIDGDGSDSPTDDEYETLRRELCGRQRKGKSGKEALPKYTKKRSRAARNNDLINILVDSMKNTIEGGDAKKVHELLPLKFRFEDDVVPPREKSEHEKEIEESFRVMELAFRAREIDDKSKEANEDPMSDKSCRACCQESFYDEQIGIICTSCGSIIVDVKDILPPWHTPSWRQHDKKEFFESLCSRVGKYQLHDLGNGRQGSVTHTKGTVWDFILGSEKDMFPHQREGFEFLWKNIAGDIRIEKLPKTLPNDSNGCIISHAPGTGKTRLTIVFLLSFLKRYPNANPVIIAPCGMLDTWEEEFLKWKVNIPFHKIGSGLSANEIQLAADKVGWQVETSGRMSKVDVRLVKLCSWIMSGGVLGISYKLFGNLMSKCQKGEKEGVIWKTLAEKPGILILDEGHTPRNGESNIWKALRKVSTQRRVILSGTPFQNNFTELYNTFCIIDPKFLKIDKATWKKLTEDRNLKNLRSMLDPYVHLHKGTILQENVPGLRDTIVFLIPPKLQKALLKAARKISIFLTSTRLVSLISVHPSMALAESKNFSKSRTFALYKDELKKVESDFDAGVKMKFVINLIQLADALGERVLIFSQYIHPLNFIKQQLKAHFSWVDGREILYMDGQLETKQRRESMLALNNNSSKAKVLLASVRACSEGISLIGASRVVLLDTVWNPSVERQAISRTYRLGQKKMVYVYRLIISGMDARQYELQAQKDHISQMIFSPADGQIGKAKTSGVAWEDKVLDQIVNLKSCGHIIEKIVHQPKECGLVETFGFVEPE